MTISVFDLFTSASARRARTRSGRCGRPRTFAGGLDADGLLGQVAAVRAELFGSLGATGHGHGSVRAVVLGLEGEQPGDGRHRRRAEPRVDRGPAPSGRLRLAGRATRSRFDAGRGPGAAPAPRPAVPPERHDFTARRRGRGRAADAPRTYYSVGGGFVVDEDAAGADRVDADPTPVPLPVHHRRRAARALPRRAACRSAR